MRTFYAMGVALAATLIYLTMPGATGQAAVLPCVQEGTTTRCTATVDVRSHHARTFHAETKINPETKRLAVNVFRYRRGKFVEPQWYDAFNPEGACIDDTGRRHKLKVKVTTCTDTARVKLRNRGDHRRTFFVSVAWSTQPIQ